MSRLGGGVGGVLIHGSDRNVVPEFMPRVVDVRCSTVVNSMRLSCAPCRHVSGGRYCNVRKGGLE
jgi:hypothetical protein